MTQHGRAPSRRVAASRSSRPRHDDDPPFLTWPRLYAIVIVALVACIAALAWLTASYR